MNLLRAILFTLIFYTGSIFIVLSAFPAAAMGREPLTRVVMAWALWHRWCARFLLGIRSKVEGPPLPPGAVIVAVKHQSMFETVEVLLLLYRPAVVLKRELADIPGWGVAARKYGVIPVDRAGGAVALRRMLKAAREAVERNRPIAIFPEGTRVLPGEQPPLQPGFAGLYRARGRSGRSGRDGQRPALAAPRLRSQARDRHLPLRRSDPARPAARRDRGARPCRHQSARYRPDRYSHCTRLKRR